MIDLQFCYQALLLALNAFVLIASFQIYFLKVKSKFFDVCNLIKSFYLLLLEHGLFNSFFFLWPLYLALPAEWALQQLHFLD